MSARCGHPKRRRFIRRDASGESTWFCECGAWAIWNLDGDRIIRWSRKKARP
jgi:hypothetical protein